MIVESRLTVPSRLRLALAFGLGAAAFGSLPAAAEVIYVGIGGNCFGHYSTIGEAVTDAASSSGADEIRVTRTVAHSGEDYVLADFDPAGIGALTIAGGFDDCEDISPSGRTVITGDGTTFSIWAVSASSSWVTLRDLELSGAGWQAALVVGGGHLIVENGWIHGQVGRGIDVQGGSFVGDAATLIADNGSLATGRGGGVRCGENGFVSLAGHLERNRAQYGGNLFVDSCTAHLQAGAVLSGTGADASLDDRSADAGGGIFIQYGSLFAHGGAQRVVIRDHFAGDSGGGLVAVQSTVALHNTLLQDNSAGTIGGAITADLSTITLDRAAQCPFIISCSQISSNRLRGGHLGTAIYAADAAVHLRNTMVDDNGAGSDGLDSLFHLEFGSVLTADGLGLVHNQAGALFQLDDGELVGQYLTAARNSDGADGDPALAIVGAGSALSLHSSVVANAGGPIVAGGGSVVGSCLLVADGAGLPAGSFTVGTPLFISAETGDIRQMPSSPGVDFCDEDAVPWPGGVDIELQSRGFDEPTNANGSPGVGGAVFDAGFDEASPELPAVLFVDGLESSTTGAWSATVP